MIDQAVVRKNVYGSGNYGTVGYSSSGTSSTNIEVLGGTVVGSVFGSGNRSGSGRSGRVTSSIQIFPNRRFDKNFHRDDWFQM